MNELIITLKGNPVQWVYFSTACCNIDDALSDFQRKCESAHINTDNVQIACAVLRDSNDANIGRAFY